MKNYIKVNFKEISNDNNNDDDDVIIIIIIIIIYQLKRCNPTFELGNPAYSNNNESIISLQQMYISLTLFFPHPLQN